MKTYIRKSHKGYYIEFPDKINAEYWSDLIGKTYEDFLNNKWILLSDKQLKFHKEHPSATIKEVLAAKLMQPAERTLELAKSEKLDLINEYDKSENVNGFDVVYNGNVISTWLSPDLRANYKNSLDSAELLGIEELSLFVGDVPVLLSTTTAKHMLALIQLYADSCYIVTQNHINTVNGLETVDDVDNYNVSTGYPDKLTFNLLME